nr:hypothetical protein BaRGS_016939 [Batillaria attramentaria]
MAVFSLDRGTGTRNFRKRITETLGVAAGQDWTPVERTEQAKMMEQPKMMDQPKETDQPKQTDQPKEMDQPKQMDQPKEMDLTTSGPEPRRENRLAQ